MKIEKIIDNLKAADRGMLNSMARMTAMLDREEISLVDHTLVNGKNLVVEDIYDKYKHLMSKNLQICLKPKTVNLFHQYNQPEHGIYTTLAKLKIPSPDTGNYTRQGACVQFLAVRCKKEQEQEAVQKIIDRLEKAADDFVIRASLMKLARLDITFPEDASIILSYIAMDGDSKDFVEKEDIFIYEGAMPKNLEEINAI